MLMRVGRVGAIGRSAAVTVAAAPAPTPTPTPTPAPNYLASVGTAPYAAYGSQRTVSGYSGPIYRLRRTSDDAVQDFACATSSDYPDYAAIATWAGSPDVRVVRWYDQTGNGRHLDAVSQAMEPWLLTTTPQDGVIPLVFDHTDMRMSVGGLSLDLLNYATFVVENRETLQRESATLQLSNEAGTTAYQGYAGWLRSSSPAGAVFQNNQWNPPRMRVFGWSNNGDTNMDHYGFLLKTNTEHRTGRQWNSTLPPQSAQRLTIGYNTVGSTANMRARMSAVVIYPTQLSSADGISVLASLRTAYKVMPNGTWDYVVRHIGDSIAEGSTTRKLRTASSWLRDSLTKNALVFNQGVGGETMSSAYSARVSRYGGTNNVFTGVQSVDFIQSATNDLAGGAGATLRMAPALYDQAALFVAYLKGQGKKVVLCTVLPRADGSWQANPDYEVQRLAYNDLVRANSAGADYVLDLAANPVMGDTTNLADTTIWSDLIHPSSLGQRYLAGAPSGTYANTHTYYHALQEVLRTATGNPAYVL